MSDRVSDSIYIPLFLSGKLYAVGGHDGKEHLNSGEVFDPSNNKWKPIAPMTTLR